MPFARSEAEYLELRTEKTDDCWNWQGSINDQGYGIAWWDGKRERAHRKSYRLNKEPIPDGLELDHLCRNRRCVNPDHLEPVTTRENLRRGEGWSGINAQKDQCNSGHDLSGSNLYVYRNQRYCRECRKLRQREYMERRRAV